MDLLAKMSTFVRVVEAGSLSAAAKQVRISAAAVSRQIASLEHEVGVALLLRTTRRMSVTEAGQGYYERCVRILREVDDAQTIGRGDQVQGALKISAPVTFGLASVAPRLRTLVSKHPGLRLDLQFDDRMIDLVLEGVDVALRVAAMPPLSTELVAHQLYAWQRVLVAAPGYLRRRGDPKSPAALAKHDALSHAIDAGSETWNLVNGELTARVRLAVRCSSNAGHVLRDLAIDGAGIAMLPPWFVTSEIANKQLRIVLPGWGSERIVVHALHRTMHRHEQRVRTVVDHLRQSYATEAEPGPPR